MPRPALILATFALVLGLTAFAPSANAASARVNYMLNCMGCHLPDGAGTPGKVPALKGQVGKFLHVDGGRAFLVQVPGTSQSRLDNAETADVLNYILTTFDADHLPSDFLPFTEDEVAQLRSHSLTNAIETRAELAKEFDRP